MIVAENLTKQYDTHVAVDSVSFTCEPGTVTGFLGPNGAGKSTTLRMLTALTSPTRGTSSVLGMPYADIPEPGRHVGVLLDAGAQHSGRTGRETLTLSAMTLGIDTGRVPEVLERVGLQKAAWRKRVGNYSLGMRQRLGIAQALLADPKVLILDEPANGLDPSGIRWMRRLLREFADAGGTVLLSSHLLMEIEAVADQLIVIGNGKIVAAGAKEELLAGRGMLVRALDSGALDRALAGFDVTPGADGARIVDATAEQIGRAALDAGVVLLELRPAEGAGLEELFLSLTSPDEEVAA
jgi:ABC-2 type transport system ATP-binding protein